LLAFDFGETFTLFRRERVVFSDDSVETNAAVVMPHNLTGTETEGTGAKNLPTVHSASNV